MSKMQQCIRARVQQKRLIVFELQVGCIKTPGNGRLDFSVYKTNIERIPVLYFVDSLNS